MADALLGVQGRDGPDSRKTGKTVGVELVFKV
jgi:hypothetical protein